MSFYSTLKNKKNLIAAHRGFRAIRPENTLSSFKESIGKCDFLEFDVNITKDLIPIIIHDSTLERTSNIKQYKNFNDKEFVYDFTLDELKTLDFGTWFIDSDPFNTIKNKKIEKNEINEEKILTLEELLIFCKNNNILANVEIKDLKDTNYDDIIVKKISDVIKKLDITEMILISSFNHSYLKQINEYLPLINTAALVEESHPESLLEYLKDLNVSSYNCCNEIITKEIVNLLKNESYKVNVYTVNSSKRKKELFSWGVDCIFTDFL